MAIWFTSDWHFSHQKAFIYEPRGYNSPEEMNRDLVARYNRFIKPDDEVYCLGDCCLGGANKLEDNYHLMRQLNGLIHIIRGNHDSDKKLDMYARLPNVVEICEGKFLKIDKYNFYLCHFATGTTNFDIHKPLTQRTLGLCGHSHTDNKFLNMDNGCYHIEVDAHHNFPVYIDEVIADFNWWNDNKIH